MIDRCAYVSQAIILCVAQVSLLFFIKLCCCRQGCCTPRSLSPTCCAGWRLHATRPKHWCPFFQSITGLEIPVCWEGDSPY
jgi:hypothetical protein